MSLENVLTSLENTEYEMVQANGRIRRWGYVEELGHHVRVVLLEDGKTILNAFIDRDYLRRYRP